MKKSLSCLRSVNQSTHGYGKVAQRIATILLSLTAIPAPIEKSHAEQHDMGTLIKDVNFDGVIDSRDATMVLAEYANVSAGNSPTFTRTQQFVADVNLDGQVTAVDASMILSTYAINSSGRLTVPVKTVTFGVSYTEQGKDAQPLVYQAYTIEEATHYIDCIRSNFPDGAEFVIVPDVTVWR